VDDTSWECESILEQLKERCKMMRSENTMLDSKTTIDKKLEKILTSGKTAGEMLIELKELMPNFDFEEVK